MATSGRSIASVQAVSMYHMQKLGPTELIGVDEQVSQYKYAASIGVALPEALSGKIHAVALYASEAGTGAVITEDGSLLIMDADPALAAGAANLAVGEWATILATIDIAAADWYEENAGGLGSIAYKQFAVPVPFQELSTLYLAYYHKGATQWNSAVGDEEKLEARVWFDVVS